MKKPNFSKEAIGASFTTRAVRVGGYSVAATAIVIAIAVVINILVSALPETFTKHDTTTAGLFSISEETEAVVSGLEEDITVYWIVQTGAEDSYLSKLLDRYEALSDHITVVKKDPDVYPTFVQQYVPQGVYNNSLIVECGERFRYVSYEEIYVYDSADYYSYSVDFDGEGALTSAIDYVTRATLPKLYTLTGHGESTLPSDFRSAVERKNYQLEELSLVTTEAVPEDASGLLVYAPASDISQKELTVLRDYMGGGGKLYLVTQPTEAPLTNLEALMADYGVSPVEGIVVEGSQNHFAWGVGYDLLPDLCSHPITDALIAEGYYVRLPVAHGLEISEELPNGVSVTKLLETSDKAFSKVAGYKLTTYEKEQGDLDGPFAMAAAVSDDTTGAAAIWVPSGYLLDSQTDAEVAGGNLSFFLNGLEWLCNSEESAFTIAAKSLDYEYLTMTTSQTALLTTLVVFVIPALVLAVGIVIRVRRKRR